MIGAIWGIYAEFCEQPSLARPVFIGPIHSGLPAVQVLRPTPHAVREGLAIVDNVKRLFGLSVVVAPARAPAAPAAGGFGGAYAPIFSIAWFSGQSICSLTTHWNSSRKSSKHVGQIQW